MFRQRTAAWLCAMLLLPLSGCNISFVRCDGPIGAPWTNEKLKTLEGNWQEPTTSDAKGSRETIRAVVNEDKNRLDLFNPNDPESVRASKREDEKREVVQITSLRSVNLLFLVNPDNEKETILVGILEVPDEDTLKMGMANPDAFRKYIEQGRLTGEVMSPYLDDAKPTNAKPKETMPGNITLRATEDELNQLIEKEGAKALFGEVEDFMVRVKK
jgi:hypothetical protein